MFDLLNWLLPKSDRFPKLYRGTVTQRLMESALNLQEALLEAQAYQDKIRLRETTHWEYELDTRPNVWFARELLRQPGRD